VIAGAWILRAENYLAKARAERLAKLHARACRPSFGGGFKWRRGENMNELDCAAAEAELKSLLFGKAESEEILDSFLTDMEDRREVLKLSLRLCELLTAILLKLAFEGEVAR
jgi:hypothetical protein